jgi:hypothetical protein
MKQIDLINDDNLLEQVNGGLIQYVIIGGVVVCVVVGVFIWSTLQTR